MCLRCVQILIILCGRGSWSTNLPFAEPWVLEYNMGHNVRKRSKLPFKKG